MLQNCLFHKIQKNFNAPINKQKSQVHYTCIHRTDFELAFLYCTMVRAAFCCCYNCFFNSRLYLIGQFAYTLRLSHCYLRHFLQEWLESVSYTHVVISDYRTLKKGSTAENLKSICIRYNLPPPLCEMQLSFMAALLQNEIIHTAESISVDLP